MGIETLGIDIGSKLAIWLVVGLSVAFAMEPWAAYLHGRVWHRRLYSIHRSHHVPQEGFWEANDIFSVLHAPPAMALILYGCLGTPGLVRELAFAVGLGMTAFGLAYMLVHDGLIHGRLPVSGLRRFRFFQRIEVAHQKHHDKGGPPFGLFRGPTERARFEARMRR